MSTLYDMGLSGPETKQLVDNKQCGGGVEKLWYVVKGILPVVGVWVCCDRYITCGGGVVMLWVHYLWWGCGYAVTDTLPVVGVW